MKHKYITDPLAIIRWQRATPEIRAFIAETKIRVEADGDQTEVVERFKKHPEISLRYKQQNFRRPYKGKNYMPQVLVRIG